MCTWVRGHVVHSDRLLYGSWPWLFPEEPFPSLTGIIRLRWDHVFHLAQSEILAFSFEQMVALLLRSYLITSIAFFLSFLLVLPESDSAFLKSRQIKICSAVWVLKSVKRFLCLSYAVQYLLHLLNLSTLPPNLWWVLSKWNVEEVISVIKHV